MTCLQTKMRHVYAGDGISRTHAEQAARRHARQSFSRAQHGQRALQTRHIKFANRLVRIHPATIPHVTCREYDAAANHYANGLLSRGVKRDDVVALSQGNRREFLTARLGTVKMAGNFD